MCAVPYTLPGPKDDGLYVAEPATGGELKRSLITADIAANWCDTGHKSR